MVAWSEWLRPGRLGKKPRAEECDVVLCLCAALRCPSGKNAHCSQPIMKSCASCMNNTGHPTGYSRMLRFYFFGHLVRLESDVSFCIAVADGPCIVAGQNRDSS